MRLFGQKESGRKAGNSRISDRFCEITEFFGDCFPVLFERYREELVPFLYGFMQSIEDAEELMPDSFAEIAAGPTAFFVKRSVDRKQTKTEQNQHGGKMMKTNRNNDPWIRGISLLLSLLMCVAQRHCTFGA
jgi:hypothetical protein